MDIGKQIKSRRKALRVTQSQLAEIAGISATTLYQIERGKVNTTLDTLDKIANVLGMEVCLQVKEVEDTNT